MNITVSSQWSIYKTASYDQIYDQWGNTLNNAEIFSYGPVKNACTYVVHDMTIMT